MLLALGARHPSGDWGETQQSLSQQSGDKARDSSGETPSLEPVSPHRDATTVAEESPALLSLLCGNSSPVDPCEPSTDMGPAGALPVLAARLGNLVPS